MKPNPYDYQRYRDGDAPSTRHPQAAHPRAAFYAWHSAKDELDARAFDWQRWTPIEGTDLEYFADVEDDMIGFDDCHDPYTFTEAYSWYHRHEGQAKDRARQLALDSVARHEADETHYVILTVSVREQSSPSRAVLGWATLGGIDVNERDHCPLSWAVRQVLDEVLPEAIEDARGAQRLAQLELVTL